MVSNLEEKQKLETELLEEFFMKYEEFKHYIENATEEDKQKLLYHHRLRIVEGIQELYSTLDSDFKTIVDMRYWNKDGQSSWAEIADELFMTVSRTKLKRNRLIQMFADAIGWA